MKFSKGRGIKPKNLPLGWCGYRLEHDEKNMYVPLYHVIKTQPIRIQESCCIFHDITPNLPNMNHAH